MINSFPNTQPYLQAEKKDEFVVAKIDATVNELSHSRVRSFPTIRLYKKGENEQVEYNGESKFYLILIILVMIF